VAPRGGDLSGKPAKKINAYDLIKASDILLKFNDGWVATVLKLEAWKDRS
jgi:hypothetical protein